MTLLSSLPSTTDLNLHIHADDQEAPANLGKLAKVNNLILSSLDQQLMPGLLAAANRIKSINTLVLINVDMTDEVLLKLEETPVVLDELIITKSQLDVGAFKVLDRLKHIQYIRLRGTPIHKDLRADADRYFPGLLDSKKIEAHGDYLYLNLSHNRATGKTSQYLHGIVIVDNE